MTFGKNLTAIVVCSTIAIGAVAPTLSPARAFTGEELAAEAKQLGAPVEIVIYPGESHGFGADFAKKNATDALNRSTAFLRKQLQVK